jgi:hypothetical protein
MKLMEKTVERRMYFLVPYNISPIQAGIQAGHALVEYAQDHFPDNDYQDFAKNHKTFIILNGGTSSSMEMHNETLELLGVKHGTFREPDLNNMLSGICFLLEDKHFGFDINLDLLLDAMITEKIECMQDIEYYFSKKHIRIALKEPIEYLELNNPNWKTDLFLKRWIKRFRLA